MQASSREGLFFASIAFFSATPHFGIEQQGVSSTLFYDPVERVVATLRPSHTFEKVVFDPWRQSTYDVNDTCAPRNAQTGDPRTDPDAEFISEITAREALQRGLKVMDSTALSLCMDNHLNIHVFNMADDGNINRIVSGDRVGTLVTT